MFIVQFEMDSFMGEPTQAEQGPGFTLHGVEHGKVPLENINVQVRLFACQAVDEPAKRFLIRRLSPAQTNAAVNIPANDVDRLAGSFAGIGKRIEIGFPVNQECNSLSVCNFPAVVIFPEKHQTQLSLQTLKLWFSGRFVSH